MTISDIRDVAIAANDRLKKLILPEDDKDQLTDMIDQGRRDASPGSSPNLSPRFPRKVFDSQQTGQSSTLLVVPGQSSPPKTNSATATPVTAAAGQTTTAQPSSDDNPEGDDQECSLVGREAPRLHLLAVLGVLIPHMKFTLQETRLETLRWFMWLHQQLPKRVRS